MEDKELEKAAHKILCDYGIKSIGQRIGILEVKKLMVKMANLQKEQDKKMYSEADMREAIVKASLSNIDDLIERCDDILRQFKNK